MVEDEHKNKACANNIIKEFNFYSRESASILTPKSIPDPPIFAINHDGGGGGGVYRD